MLGSNTDGKRGQTQLKLTLFAGQLGDGTNKNSNMPVAVQGLTVDFNGSSIEAGAYHTVNQLAGDVSALIVSSCASVRHRLNVYRHERRLVLVSRCSSYLFRLILLKRKGREFIWYSFARFSDRASVF